MRLGSLSFCSPLPAAAGGPACSIPHHQLKFTLQSTDCSSLLGTACPREWLALLNSPAEPRRAAPPAQVVGALLDAEADESFVNNLILSVRSLIPVEGLVEEVEKRNKLKLLNPFLEQLVSEGSKVRMQADLRGRECRECWCD